MLEHIFRNLNDIRVFDLMTEFDENDYIEICSILELLEYNESDRIQIEDSIEHLIKEQVLNVKQIKEETKTGCKICKITDRLGLPRFGSHTSHVAEKKGLGNVNTYYMQDNGITRALRTATFAHISLTLEEKILRKCKDK